MLEAVCSEYLGESGMRDEFYSIYQALSRDYERQMERWRHYLPEAGVIRPTQDVTDAIDSALQEFGDDVRLRPDGYHFLMINLHQMYDLPLSHPRSSIDQFELKEALFSDVQSILADAREESDGEISGGGILRSIARLWRDLRINGIDIWG